MRNEKTPPAEWPGGSPAPKPMSAVPILVVDDNPAKILAVVSVLAPVGYRIVTAESGLAALRLVAAEDFAVILLDVRMPIMDGFETAGLIRMRRQSEMTPIIFNTAHAKAEFVTAELYSQGAVDFMSAPVAPEVLRAKVAVFANLYLQAQRLAIKAREVQESADRLRLLTDTAPIGIFQTDADNRYVYTNPRWCELTGLSPDEAEGLPWDVIIDRERNEDLLNAPGGSGYGPELINRFESGAPASKRFLQLKSKSIRDGAGETTGWVGTLSDVTAVVQGEAHMAEARDKAATASMLKSDFLATMSHEIRTPMNGVLGMTDLLMSTDLDPRQRDYAETVRSSGAALLTVVNDILDFSKIETGRLDLEEIPYSVPAVVADVVGLLGGLADNKGLELRAELDDSIPAWVNGDPGRFRQILTNLIGNAIKFSAEGSIIVRASASAGDPATVIRVEVSDSGVGIAPDKLETIFEPFVQEDTSTTRIHGGTGLGLAISQQLVTLMGGEFGVVSEPGVGSTFWFSLAVKALADTETRAPEPQGAHGPPVSSGLESRNGVASGQLAPAGRILLAEDNLINQKVAVAMLTNAGYQVTTARNGVEAVQAAADASYDAILMDCRMPELNGYDATTAIRRREGTTRHTPIVALTANARPEDRERCLAAGMDDYLSKPISKDALLTMVRSSILNASDPEAVA